MSNYTFVNTQNSRGGTCKAFVYSTGTECEAIMLPIIDTVGVQLSFDSAGTAKVQATISPYNDVDAGTAKWIDWDLGDVTDTSQGNCHKATAIRVYRTSGTIRLEVTV